MYIDGHVEVDDVHPGMGEQTWAAKAFAPAMPSTRIVVVLVLNRKINTHDNILPGFPGGKRKVQDKTSDDTAMREHPEETGVQLVRPLKSVACEFIERPNDPQFTPHWFELFCGQDITDEQLDTQLIGTVRGSSEIITLAEAKRAGWGQEWVGVVPGRDEIAGTMTAEKILNATANQFISRHKRMALNELASIVARAQK